MHIHINSIRKKHAAEPVATIPTYISNLSVSNPGSQHKYNNMYNEVCRDFIDMGRKQLYCYTAVSDYPIIT